MEYVASLIRSAIETEFGITDLEPQLTVPDVEFGDLATNVALQLAGKVGDSPRNIAQKLQARLSVDNQVFQTVTIAGPGFINFAYSQAFWTGRLAELSAANSWELDSYRGQQIVIEYSDPNPFKELHIGHLYTSVVGDVLANLLQNAGAQLHRVNFGGDVGLHVGKTMWAIIEEFGGEYPKKLQDIPVASRATWLAACYVRGTTAYEEDEAAKAVIVNYNKAVYELHQTADEQSAFARIYWTCRQWSYESFDAFYARIGTSFEKYYPESQTAPIGLAAVREQLAAGIFKESDGAVVFDGEAVGLHTRVFINSAGLPTYETKDVGLALLKYQDYQFDRSIIITGNEQDQYMKVVIAAYGSFEPELAAKTTHLTHGMVRIKGHGKMSSRKGNTIRANQLLDMVNEQNTASTGEANWDVALGAIKYSFLKQRLGSDIQFDIEDSISTEGNSGPYIQYACVRATSILRKAEQLPRVETGEHLNEQEQRLIAKLDGFSQTLDSATAQLAPHLICTYLYELAQTFNRFYEHNPVIQDEQAISHRIMLVSAYVSVLQKGITLLGMTAPEKM